MEWLSSLRWVGSFELWPCVLAFCLAAATCIALLIHSAPPAAFSTSLLHFCLLAAVIMLAPRWLCAPLLGVLCISQINYSVLLLVNPPQIALIDRVYLLLAVVGTVSLMLGLPDLLRQSRQVAIISQRDDFRWLLTRSPLQLRWRVQCELSAMKRACDQPRPPGG